MTAKTNNFLSAAMTALLVIAPMTASFLIATPAEAHLLAVQTPVVLALALQTQSGPAEIEPAQPVQEPPAATEPDAVSKLLEPDPFFISAGLANLQSLLFYQGGAGFMVSEKFSVAAGGGLAFPKRLLFNERTVYLSGFHVGALALYHVTENLRVGLGGGLLNLYGRYSVPRGQPRPEIFKVGAPYVSAILGFQFKFILITVGVNYVF